MRRKYTLITVSVVAAIAAVVAVVSAGDPDNPPGPPETTYSYTLEDIYDRLATGAAGTPITFTEPISGPGTGTMHTLDEIMAIAPQLDDTNGATSMQVLVGKTAWGLTGAQWGMMTGTMADNGVVVITPTAGSQAIAAGYHDGTGYVVGDGDLVAGNIRCGVVVFGVTGIISEYVAKTGQTGCWDNVGSSISCTGTGQDGEYRNGSLPVMAPVKGTYTFGEYNRTSFSCSDGFTDNGDGTVTDNLTGLVWLKDASCSDLAGTDANGAGNWTTALAAANSVTSGTCGLSDGSSAGDWRLPNINELRSLFDPTRPSPYLSAGHPFTGTQSYHYWSSTTYAGGTGGRAWFVNLGAGHLNHEGKGYTKYVWPVRGGQ